MPVPENNVSRFCRLLCMIIFRIGCAITCGLCGFLYFCCPPCPQNITSKLAFHPPLPSYKFKKGDDSEHVLELYSTVHCCGYLRILRQDAFFLHPTKKRKVAVIYLKCTEEKKFTILYSHGNGCDVGHNHLFCVDLSVLTDCDVVAYDYAGYGMSNGSPSEKNVNADVEMVFNYILNTYESSPDKIVLYGESLGSVPTVHLASKVTCAGVVLHSALSSGCRQICPSFRYRCVDTLDNMKKLPKVTAPVFIIHGTNDEVINISHAKELLVKCKRPVEPLWIKDAYHNNISIFSEYKTGMKRFIFEDLNA